MRRVPPLVVEALFVGLPLGRIVGLRDRITSELIRMARDYRDERRPIPHDLELLTQAPRRTHANGRSAHPHDVGGERVSAMHCTVVLDVVGLTSELVGPETPNLARLARRGGMRPVQSIAPAVTCPVQSTYLTGTLPRAHGIVGNGWYDRDLDPGASEAFAVVDHQVAHVYVKNPARVAEVAMLLAHTAGVERVLDGDGQRAFGLDHPRSGDLVVIAEKNAWFTYYYWLDDARAPDFARTVDIHRKPGFDPVELFLEPTLRAPKLRIAQRLAQKTLGFRALMDAIPLDASLVHGSHGRLPDRSEESPVFLTTNPETLGEGPIRATDVKELLLRHVFGACTRHHRARTRRRCSDHVPRTHRCSDHVAANPIAA